jgi:purine-cytosine permease-like protein
LGASALDHALGVLLGQLAKAVVTVDGFLVGLDFVARHIAGEVFAVFPGLAVVIRAVGTFAQNAELAAFHVFDLSDLSQERLR